MLLSPPSEGDQNGYSTGRETLNSRPTQDERIPHRPSRTAGGGSPNPHHTGFGPIPPPRPSIFGISSSCLGYIHSFESWTRSISSRRERAEILQRISLSPPPPWRGSVRIPPHRWGIPSTSPPWGDFPMGDSPRGNKNMSRGKLKYVNLGAR